VAIKGTDLEKCVDILKANLGASKVRESLQLGRTWIYVETNNPQETQLRCAVEQAKLLVFSGTTSEDLKVGKLPVGWEDAGERAE
jgi:hypothetical protein